jgi:hypothetical protein
MPSGLKTGPLVIAAQRLRIEGLRRIDAALAAREHGDVRTFVDALSAMLVLDVDAIVIARQAGILTSTVTRWTQRFHEPSVDMAADCARAVRQVAAQEIAKAEAFVPDAALKAA